MIGLRYTLSRRKGRSDGFVSFISAMSMASIALGVMALIIVLSVMNGFQKEVRDKMLSVLSHAEVLSIGAPIPDWQKTAAELKKQQPEIIGAAPFLRGQGLLTSGTNVRGVQLNGIDPQTESQVSDVAKNMKIGQLSDLKPGEFKIILGTDLARILGVIPGEKVNVMVPQGQFTPAGTMPRKPAGRSIEDRPEHINDRSTFGHWEMDSVESCQGVSNTYIVMTERKTRWELIIPSPDKTAASVVAAIDGLEAKYGDLFPKVFRSITCDNGCEFADAAGIEQSASGKGTRTEVYYCHPYRPSERGSNENQNGLIRRHLPKGTDLSTVSYEETKRIEAWLNNYPRKMFGYLCSEQLFREEMALILAS